MGWNDDPRGQVDGVEDLKFPGVGMAWVRKIAMIVITRERDQSRGVGRCVSDCVDNLHVPYVVNVERFFKTDYKPLKKN